MFGQIFQKTKKIKHIVTSALSSKDVLETINDNMEAIFFDIDYTVKDFGLGHEAAINAIKGQIHKGLGEEIDNIFRNILAGLRRYDLLSDEDKRMFDNLTFKIKELESSFINDNGIKYWSREIMAIIAAERVGLSINADLINKVSELYWQTIETNSPYYDDAIVFLDKVQSYGIPVVWVTGSDSRLFVNDSKNGFEMFYSPEYALKQKEQRLVDLIKRYPGKLYIGDPVDKPQIWKEIFKVYSNPQNLMAIGDSYDNDLKPIVELGGSTILIKRN